MLKMHTHTSNYKNSFIHTNENLQTVFQLPTSASVLQNVSGTGQKNVILRVLPQQLSNAQTGSVSVVLPQQVLQQTIKVTLS